MNAVALTRPKLMAVWLLAAAAALVPFDGTVNLLPSVGTGGSIMASKPKATDYRSKVGPIPPDNFDNDLPYNPDVDVSDYKDLEKTLDAELEKTKGKRKE